MRDLHSFGWYAARIAPHMPKKAFKPAPTRLLGGLAYLLVTILSFYSILFTNLNPWLYLLPSFIIGLCFAGLGFLGHEILHGTVVRRPWLRDLLGAIAFWPLTTGPKLWRKWHNMTHHKHTQDEELDPDAWPTMQKFKNNRVLRLIYRLPFSVRAGFSLFTLTLMFTLHSLKMFFVYIKEFNPKKQPTVWVEAVLPWATWIGLLVWVGFDKWFFVYLLPLLIGNFIVMAYISTNHRLNPLVPVNDPLANSLSVTNPKWIDVLHFNFSYHTEHHLFPGMNPKYYPMVKAHIKKMWPDRYHEMPFGRALITLVRTPRLYYENNHLIDPHHGKLFGSLGNGLNPNKLKIRKIKLNKQ